MTCVVASAGLPPKLCFAEYHRRNATSRREGMFLANDSVNRLDVFHEGEETLGESGVNIDGALQKRVRLIREHESAEDLHEFATLGGKDGSAEDAVIRSVDDNFHEARCFAALNGARHVGHRASANFKFKSFGASIFFGHA